MKAIPPRGCGCGCGCCCEAQVPVETTVLISGRFIRFPFMTHACEEDDDVGFPSSSSSRTEEDEMLGLDDCSPPSRSFSHYLLRLLCIRSAPRRKKQRHAFRPTLDTSNKGHITTGKEHSNIRPYSYSSTVEHQQCRAKGCSMRRFGAGWGITCAYSSSNETRTRLQLQGERRRQEPQHLGLHREQYRK